VDVYGQREFDVRCEWGPEAIPSVAPGCRVAIERDIPLAGALDASRVVPELVDGVYRAAS
jgi:hypothetical protein